MKKQKLKCEDCGSRGDGVFCDLKSDELTNLSSHKVTNTYKKGQTLFFEGNPPFGIYCLRSGKIKVTKTGPDGKEIIVRIAKDGDVIGHRSLLSEQFYSATATALEDSNICFIDKKWILKAIEDMPTLATNFIKKLSSDMGAAESRLSSFGQRNVRERLAELILLLKESFGTQEGDKIKIDIKLTREEMASMIGVANETLIRFLSEFRDLNLIEQKGKTIFIVNEEELVEFANISY